MHDDKLIEIINYAYSNAEVVNVLIIDWINNMYIYMYTYIQREGDALDVCTVKSPHTASLSINLPTFAWNYNLITLLPLLTTLTIISIIFPTPFSPLTFALRFVLKGVSSLGALLSQRKSLCAQRKWSCTSLVRLSTRTCIHIYIPTEGTQTFIYIYIQWIFIVKAQYRIKRLIW